MNNLIIYVLLIFVTLIILGLHTAEKNDQYDKIQIYENFKESSEKDQTEGASEYYKWGYPKNIDSKYGHKHRHKYGHEHRHTHNYYQPTPYCPPEQLEPSELDICKKCDITLNKNIDKYVLKSSVPPCPNTSKYATKNMVSSCPDLNKYILKSEIPSCDCPDIKKYIKKSEIPPCPECPLTPRCPICPKCPSLPHCKQIFEYNIDEHPEFNKYEHKKNCYKTPEDIPDFTRKYILRKHCNRNPKDTPNFKEKYIEKNKCTGYLSGLGYNVNKRGDNSKQHRSQGGQSGSLGSGSGSGSGNGLGSSSGSIPNKDNNSNKNRYIQEEEQGMYDITGRYIYKNGQKVYRGVCPSFRP